MADTYTSADVDNALRLVVGGRAPAPAFNWERSVARLDALADQYKVPRALVHAVVKQESNWDPYAEGDGGRARGWFQLHPGAAKDAGIDPRFRHEPDLNMLGGVRYLALKLKQAGGDEDKALRLYNGGGDPHYVANVRRHMGQGQGQPPAAPPQSSGLLARVRTALSPRSAEAAAPASQGGTYTDADIAAAMQALRGIQPQQAPAQATPHPPTARSTPEDAAAYRQWARQQAAGAPAPQAPVAPMTPTPQTPAGASQGPHTPSPADAQDAAGTRAQRRQRQAAATPEARLQQFQQLPAITALSPEERQAAVAEFQGLQEAQQRAILASEPAADITQAVQEGPRLTPEQQLQALPRPQPPAPTAEDVRMRGVQPGVTLPTPPADAPLEESLTAPSTMVPLLMGAGPATTLGKTALRGAVTGAATAAMQPAQTWQQKGEQAATGGALGAVLAPVAEKVVAPLVTKLGNWGRGVLDPAYRELVDLSKRFGVRLSTGDVTRGAIAPKVETALEQVPVVGAGGFRQAQQREVGAAGTRLREGTTQAMRQTPYRDLPTVERLARQGNKEAQILLEEVQAAGDDWTRVVQTSGKLNLFLDRQRGEQLYRKVDELAAPLGNMKVDQTLAKIDTLRRDVADDVLPTPEVKREITGALGRVREELSPTQTVQPSMGVRDPLTGTLRAQPVTERTQLADTTYGRMRQLHSRLGDLQREAAEPAVARALGQVKTALGKEMDAFAAHAGVPALTRAHRQASTFWRTHVVPYREGMLAKAIEKDLPDEIYQKFVRQGSDRAEYFYKGLDPKGQAAVRAGMVEEAYTKATAGDRDIFSPAKFATALQQIQEATGVFFKGHPQWEIDGFRRLMRHAERAGQYAENPPTGQRVIPWLTGGVFLTGGASLPQIAGAAGTIGGMRLLFMTPQGRNFLLAANRLEPGSPAMQRLLDGFARRLPRLAEIQAAERQGQATKPSQ